MVIAMLLILGVTDATSWLMAALPGATTWLTTIARWETGTSTVLDKYSKRVVAECELASAVVVVMLSTAAMTWPQLDERAFTVRPSFNRTHPRVVQGRGSWISSTQLTCLAVTVVSSATSGRDKCGWDGQTFFLHCLQVEMPARFFSHSYGGDVKLLSRTEPDERTWKALEKLITAESEATNPELYFRRIARSQGLIYLTSLRRKLPDLYQIAIDERNGDAIPFGINRDVSRRATRMEDRMARTSGEHMQA